MPNLSFHGQHELSTGLQLQQKVKNKQPPVTVGWRVARWGQKRRTCSNGAEGRTTRLQTHSLLNIIRWHVTLEGLQDYCKVGFQCLNRSRPGKIRMRCGMIRHQSNKTAMFGHSLTK